MQILHIYVECRENVLSGEIIAIRGQILHIIVKLTVSVVVWEPVEDVWEDDMGILLSAVNG